MASTMAFGMPFGASITRANVASNPVYSPSATVGTSGSRGERFAPETASATSLPARAWAGTDGQARKPQSTWPPITSCTAGAVPLYGT